MKYPNTYDDDDGVDVADIGRMSVKALDNDDTAKACRSTIEDRIALVINVSVSVTHPSGIDSPIISTYLYWNCQSFAGVGIWHRRCSRRDEVCSRPAARMSMSCCLS